MFDPGVWTAQWIEPPEGTDGPTVQRPVHQLVGRFRVEGRPSRATLRFTAHGVVEMFVNGARVGDSELLPGFTAYRKRLQVHTFDVTDLVVGGDNAIGAQLSDGWWRGQHGVGRHVNCHGSTVALLAELTITLDDGSQVVVGTDSSWRAGTGHITAADLMAGEVHDMRRRDDRWCTVSVDHGPWSKVTVAGHPFTPLCDPVGPSVRRVGELAPVSINRIGPTSQVVDFGQNSNGWVRLRRLGPADTTVTIVHGEALNPDGTVTIDNCRGLSLLRPESLAIPFQTDVVVSAGDDAVFEPHHSTKGFRYVQIDGLAEDLEPSDIVSVVVHTDLAPIGSFSCSDDRINRLHAAADWSFRGNACEIPTDCPTRERSGWTGDWQVYVGTAAYLYDVTDWSRKWLFDATADQLENGAVTEIVPDPYHGGPHGDPGWEFMQGPAGWGDAVCHVPWELYLSTGRLDVIEENIDTMKRWLAFAESRAAGGRFRKRAKARPVALPHERYIWDTGFHFGEWLEPHVELSDMDSVVAALGADMGPTATAFIVRSSRELAAMLRLLDRDIEAGRYDILAANALDAWRTEFVDPDGHVQPLTQANLVRAIAFDLLPLDLVGTAVDDLVRLVRDAGTHVGTGFLATPFLLPVLADHGHLDLAYELLFQSTPPSWLTMIDRGATTIWEGWAGITESGEVLESSLNHYSKGAVISFLHRYTAGLQILEPGYRRFRVAPRPGGGISSAVTHHDCPFGRIEVSWRLDNGRGRVDVTVPVGTSAELLLPDGMHQILGPGRHTHGW